MKCLKKVIIPVAGLGTRMLPATKAVPKEMLPIVDKPIIQIIVEEAVNAGFSEIIFVTHSSKNSIEDHFDTSFELEATLEKRVKKSLLKEIREITKLNVFITSVRQGEAKGLGHAVLAAKKIIGNEPFAVMLPDMILDDLSRDNNFSLMVKDFEKNHNSLILLGEARKKDLNKFGIAKVKKINGIPHYKIEEIIEKPSVKKAPSNLFAAGRYIFENEFITFLDKAKPDKSGEIQLTDALDVFLKIKKNVYGIKLDGKIFDCGNKAGLLIANLEFAKKDPNLKKELKNYLRNF